MKVYNFAEEKFKRNKRDERKAFEELSRLTGRSPEAIKYGYTSIQDRAWDIYLYVIATNQNTTLEETLDIIKRELGL